MNFLKSILAIIVGMVVITAVTELIEYAIVSLIMGVESDPGNPAPYFNARNQTTVLIFKHFYNFFGGFCGGYVVTRIVRYKETLHAYLLIVLQLIAIGFAIIQPEIRQWLPISLWVTITLVTCIGIYIGMRLFVWRIANKTQV